MIPIHTVLGVLLILFAMVGSLRGWAKEVIVSFSVFLALFVEHVLLNFLPGVDQFFFGMSPETQFYTRAIVFIVITVFGYASPTVATKLGAKVARERLQDLLLGFFLGVFNGFLVIGTLLYFLQASYYGVPEGMYSLQQAYDGEGQPIYDDDDQPVLEAVYLPGAKGIGGIIPPEKETTSDNLSRFLPPAIIARSDAVLYLAVAAAFVFVIVVFI